MHAEMEILSEGEGGEWCLDVGEENNQKAEESAGMYLPLSNI